MAASRLIVSSEIESASSKEKASISASRSAGATRIFFKQAFATSNPMRLGARRVALRRRATISSRFSSLNSNATIADASTTLSVTVFADEPRRFVPPREIEARDPRDDLVHPKPAWRPRRLVDQRPQFALQRPMVGFGTFAQPPDLVFWHAFDRKIQDRAPKWSHNRAFLAQQSNLVAVERRPFGCRRAAKQLPPRAPPSAFLMPASPEDLLAYLANLSIETEK